MPRYSCIYVALELLGSFSLSLIGILEVCYYQIIIFEDSVSYTTHQNCTLNPISAPVSLIIPIRENVIRVKFERQSKIKKQSSERDLIVIRVTIRVDVNDYRKLDKRNDKILYIHIFLIYESG